ncbi:MAG: ABC transporter substrate-binding protein, partial [Microbacterium sp.]
RAPRAAQPVEPAPAAASTATPDPAGPAPTGPAPVAASTVDDGTDWLLDARDADTPAAARVGGGYARSGSTPSVPAAEPALEDLFTGARSTDDLGTEPVAKKKKRRRIGGWIALGVVLVILGGLAAGGLYVWNTYEDKIREVMGWEEPKDYEAGLANGEAVVTIASGDDTTTISNSLF